MAYKAKEEQQAYWREYHIKNRERKNAASREYNRRHGARYRQNAKIKREKHRKEYRNKPEKRIKWMAANAARRARIKGIECTANLSDVLVPLKVTECPCCGICLDYSSGNGHSMTKPSLDRIDPSIGYMEGNLSIICCRCNTIKNNATAAELRMIADYIERHRKSTVVGR